MLRINSFNDDGYGIGVRILDWDGSKYAYSYDVDLKDYPYLEGEGEFFTPQELSPLELPSKILTLVVEKYMNDLKGR